MMERESLNVDKRLSDNKSLVVRYQMMLKETRDATPPTEKRTNIAFKIFEELLSHMGVFKEIMTEIKEEMEAAVYSDQLTAEEKPSGSPRLQKLPFFTLVRRIVNSRDERSEELEAKLETVMKKLFSKQQEYEEALVRISQQEETMQSLQEEIEELNERIAEEKMVLKETEANFEKERKEFGRKENNLQLDIQDLKDELEELTRERDILRPYKNGYDKLQKAFQTDEVETKLLIRDRRTPVIATRRAHLISNIDAALRLEDQLLQVQNLTIEEFDQQLESHRSQISLDLDAATESFLDGESRLRQLEAERADVELVRCQRRFGENVEQLNTELGLLRQHTTMLKEQLQQLEQAAKAMGKEPPKQILKKGGKKKADPAADDDDFLGDPFVVHERVFSKYAAMLYTSANSGKTYNEFKDAKYCPACGEKTVICPHKIGHQDFVFQVPFNTTHVKITRPKVKINSKVVDRALGLASAPSEDSRGPLFSRESMKMIGMTSSLASMPPATPGSQFSEDSLGDTRFKHSFNRLWEDYKARDPVERQISRPIEQDRLMSIIEQFWATVLWDDDYALDDEGFACLIDNLYLFFHERYLKQDIAFLAAYDFINALMVSTPNYQVLQIFCHCLVNNFDGAVFRYLLLLADFVDRVEWRHVEDFRGFITTVYPFMNEDDIETFQIGYISYSENKISKALVMEYLMYIILKYREPRFLDMENRLLQSPQQEFGSMTEREFVAVLENLVPLTHERLARRLFHEAELAAQQEASPPQLAPVSKLSHISSYIALVQSAPTILQEMDQNILKNREVNIEDNERKELEQKYSESSPAAESLSWTFRRFRDLAQNMARSAEFRQQHGVSDFLE